MPLFMTSCPCRSIIMDYWRRKDESPSIVEPLQKLIQWGFDLKEQEYDQTVYMEHTIVRNFAQDKLKEEGLDKRSFLSGLPDTIENLVSQTGSLWDILKAQDYYFEAEDFESASEIVESTSNLLIRWGHIELAMNLLNESINSTSGRNKNKCRVHSCNYLLPPWRLKHNIENI